MTSKLALQGLPCQVPGVIGSVLGLVGRVSVYCDWVKWKVGSATSISVWQHVQLSEQIRPGDTLASCCNQPTNKPRAKPAWSPKHSALRPNTTAQIDFFLSILTTSFQTNRYIIASALQKKKKKKKVISDVCCRPLSWKQNKMAAKQHVKKSSLSQMLCIYNLFDHWNQNIITLFQFCQRFI